jgi:hypothetical protein
VRFEDGAPGPSAIGAGVDLGQDAAQVTLLVAIGAVDGLVRRRDQFARGVLARLEDSPSADPIARLRCLRGIDTLTAAELCAEIGAFERFAPAEQLRHCVGLATPKTRAASSGVWAR